MWIYKWIDDSPKNFLARQEKDHVFMLEDGVKVANEQIDNDGIHFSTWAKCSFFWGKKDLDGHILESMEVK